MKTHLIVIASLALGCAPALAARATVHTGAHGTTAHVRTGHVGHVGIARGVRGRDVPVYGVVPLGLRDCVWRRAHGEPLGIF
jgi:hypothetical protein